MEKTFYKRVVSVEMVKSGLRVGFCPDSNDAKDGKVLPDEYVVFDREQFAATAVIGAKVKVTYKFGE